MVNAIFAYKVLDHFWKPKDEYFWKAARISTHYASKFYTTVLYADIKTYELLTSRGVKFDKFVDCTERFANITEHTYGATKMLAMMEQKEPYIILDLDTVIFSRINSSKAICYGNKEIDVTLSKPPVDKKTDIDYLIKYYYSSYKHFSDRHPEEVLSVDWNTYPSNCLIAVNSPFIVKEIYYYILQMLKVELKNIPPLYTVQFYEQFLLYSYLAKNKIDTEFIYNHPPGEDFRDIDTLLDLYQFKYIHLDRYHSDDNTKKVIDLLEKTLD